MPSYKTHSIHGEVIYDLLDKQIDLNLDSIKSFCIGPDTLIAFDYETFEYQHSNKVKEYFENLLRIIKEDNLQYNEEVMAFLYGQLDHYVLDITMHPLIYYMTENLPKNKKIPPHGLVEMWIDEYVMEKFNKKDVRYYNKWSINDHKTKEVIDKLYEGLFSRKNESANYSRGITFMNIFDRVIRRSEIIRFISKNTSIGNISYDKDINKVSKYLNKNRNLWKNPETNELLNSSFDELWNKSIIDTLELIENVNGYLYHNKTLNNKYINNDISYNTALPCINGQTLKYARKYKRRDLL